MGGGFLVSANLRSAVCIIFGVPFDQPRQLSTVSMRNGYAKSDRIYARNSRVKRLRISASKRGTGWPVVARHARLAEK